MAETLITVNMRNFLLKQARNKRFVRAAGYVREKVAKHMKLSPENVKLSIELNNMIMKHYSKSMKKLKLSVSLDNGVATAKPFERSIITKRAAAKSRSFGKMNARLFPEKAKNGHSAASTVAGKPEPANAKQEPKLKQTFPKKKEAKAEASAPKESK
ncbi:MAG: hypothetical protein ACP5UC_03135 [Candidatus Micrarchaeia archaeon]